MFVLWLMAVTVVAACKGHVGILLPLVLELGSQERVKTDLLTPAHRALCMAGYMHAMWLCKEGRGPFCCHNTQDIGVL